MKLKNYFEELKRRHVFKSGIAYLIVAWLIAQIASLVLPAFEAPPYILKILLFLLLIGFPVNLVISWIYDVTPEGIKKTKSLDEKSYLKNSRLNKVIISSLVLVVVVIASSFFFKEVLIPDKSIAVLAFADMSPEKDQEYFSDGISEELLNIITRTPDLRVSSRTSSFSFKDKGLTAEAIGKELKVAYILEGSVRKADNTLRITAQLINTADGAHVWSETYDRYMDDILKIQDEIAAAVSKKLQITLGYTVAEKKVDTEAYTLFLKARHLTHQNSKEAYIKAEEIIKASIAIDTTYAPSYSLLANIYDTGSYNFLTRPVAEGIVLGIAAAEKAVALDPEYADAHANLASLQMNAWQFTAADKNMKTALRLAPNNSSILGSAALMKFGHTEQAIALIEQAIAKDPVVYGNYYNLGYYNYNAGNLDKADAALDTFMIYNPNSAIVHYVKCMILLARGEAEAALVEAEKEPHAFFKLYARHFALFALGRKAEADLLLNELEDTYGATEAANMADAYAFRGEIDTAFEWLNKAVALKDPVLIDGLNYPSFKKLYGDPRWGQLIAKMGVPKDHGYPME